MSGCSQVCEVDSCFAKAVLFEVRPVEISSSDAKSAHRPTAAVILESSEALRCRLHPQKGMAWTPFTVDPQHRICAWVLLCVLYLIPISFYGYKTWSTLQSDAPSVQTSIGAFGHLPFIYYCIPKNMFDNHKTQTATNNKIGLVKPKQVVAFDHKLDLENPSIRGCELDGTQQANRKPFIYGLSKGAPGTELCFLLNATEMQVVKKASIRVELVLTGVNGSKPADQLLLLVREPDGSLQAAGSWAPGMTVRTLEKKREGSMGGEHASFKDEILDAIVQFFSPRFKNVYTTELVSQWQDEEEETSTLRQKFTAKKYNVSKAVLDLLFPRKQYYKMTLQINSEHVVQEMEVGRVPQLVFLLTGLGGYISVVTSILHVIFVKRFPASRVVETYDATTPFWGEQSAGELAVEGRAGE